MFYSCKSQFQEKYQILPFKKFPCLVLARNTIMLPHLIIYSSLYYLSTSRLWEVKAKENFKLLVIKVVVVAYERWLLTRGFKYSDLTWKLLVFWKTGGLREVVATGGSTVINANEYMKDDRFKLRRKIWIYDWSSQLVLQTTSAAVKFKPEKGKKSGLDRIQTHDLCDTAAVLCQMAW